MAIAAVPRYLGDDFSTASPGMRFGMYLAIWRNGWRKAESADLKKIGELNGADRELLGALRRRQRAMLPGEGGKGVAVIAAEAVAPFTTGLGNEHPTENGFAFLWPYGLPYLPGSGVKGVLREAARELSSGKWGDTHGWSDDKRHSLRSGKTIIPLSDLDLLFGLESDDGGREHFRGVLTFWDVIPDIEGEGLAVEVMTPHQKHYYQDGEPPHDSGQPIPITFLTVPPGSRFRFHVVCDTGRLERLASELLAEEEGRPRWQVRLEAAFRHAFDWLGFGAKTAVGYGAMQMLSPEEIEAEERAESARSLRCKWVDDALQRLARENHTEEEQILRGKRLAECWRALEDAPLKEKALRDIRARWEEKGWWRHPPGKAARKARDIYEEDAE